jgi:hypothetical protein
MASGSLRAYTREPADMTVAPVLHLETPARGCQGGARLQLIALSFAVNIAGKRKVRRFLQRGAY